MKEQVEPILKKKLETLKSAITNIKVADNERQVERIKRIIHEINHKEEKLTTLIEKKNELQELENELRHVQKKNQSFHIEDYEKTLKRNRTNVENANKLKKQLELVAKILLIQEKREKIGLWDKLLVLFRTGQTIQFLEQDGTLFHLLLEEKYLLKVIEQTKEVLEKENFDRLKQEIEALYKEQYIPLSQQILKQTIRQTISQEKINRILETIEDVMQEKKEIGVEEETPILDACKESILQLYPVVLTTVDSVISNYREYLYKQEKIDYVIIDEASQCDILSALPLLYIAKQLIVVGDSKQLSAITDLQGRKCFHSVEEAYDYEKTNFLSTIQEAIHPHSEMLLEHYRCDYKIINYCNKYFYDNQLKIYKDSKPGAISFIEADKGKYVEIEEGSYKNEREIKSIQNQIGNTIEGKFIISPFKPQAKVLKEQYNDKQCGTIHTFQGRGEKQVYFSAVLNDTKECVSHITGPNNLFTPALINVAVSRAKEKFVLVGDTEFFKKYDVNMKNLIEYIEIYGEEIPDKTVCVFDYLYQQMPMYVQTIPGIDNPFEEKAFHLLEKYIQNKGKKYQIVKKLLLAEFVTDEPYLNENPELKAFVLHNAHIDFCLYTNTIRKPILAIEIDGEKHKEIEQQERDRKKEELLEHMGIPLLRIKSKVVWEEEEFFQKVEEKIKEIEIVHE